MAEVMLGDIWCVCVCVTFLTRCNVSSFLSLNFRVLVLTWAAGRISLFHYTTSRLHSDDDALIFTIYGPFCVFEHFQHTKHDACRHISQLGAFPFKIIKHVSCISASLRAGDEQTPDYSEKTQIEVELLAVCRKHLTENNGQARLHFIRL